MAERRSGAWFRGVANLFWLQCGMPVFIYGMFKDTNGKLRAMLRTHSKQHYHTHTFP